MTTTRSISIAGLDKVAVLRALFNAALPAAVTRDCLDPEPLTIEEVDMHLRIEGGYVEYVRGRPIKLDLSGDELDPVIYDRDNYLPGAAESVINILKATGDPDCFEIKSIQILAAAERAAEQLR